MEVEEIMDDPDATHSKPIENYFGNFDRELQKTGGFQKVTDDRIIKYSKDLIEEGQSAASNNDQRVANTSSSVESVTDNTDVSTAPRKSASICTPGTSSIPPPDTPDTADGINWPPAKEGLWSFYRRGYTWCSCFHH